MVSKISAIEANIKSVLLYCVDESFLMTKIPTPRPTIIIPQKTVNNWAAELDSKSPAIFEQRA